MEIWNHKDTKNTKNLSVFFVIFVPLVVQFLILQHALRKRGGREFLERCSLWFVIDPL